MAEDVHQLGRESALRDFRGSGTVLLDETAEGRPGESERERATRDIAVGAPSSALRFVHVVWVPRRLARIQLTRTHCICEVALGGRVDWYLAVCDYDDKRPSYSWLSPGCYFDETLALARDEGGTTLHKRVSIQRVGPLAEQGTENAEGVPSSAGVLRQEIPSNGVNLVGTYTWSQPFEGINVRLPSGQTWPMLPLFQAGVPLEHCDYRFRAPIFVIRPSL